MTTALRSRPRALAVALALVAGVGTLAVSNPAQAQVPDPGTGAQAFKNCPADVAAPGQTINCAFVVFNRGDNPATVTALTETVPANALGQPLPGSTVVNLTCTVPGGAVIGVGGTLAPNTACAGTVPLTVPNNPALCGTDLIDAVTIGLAYPGTALTAGAFATETTRIRCPALTITKTADELSKVGDPVTYTFVICNTGQITVNRGSVTDNVLGNLTQFFPATLTPGQCVTVVRMRTVVTGDPDPLVNTVTATYSAGTATATATATDSTNLFQPNVGVTKNCAPDPVDVGGVVNCTIVVTNLSSPDTPVLINGTISDTQSGNLLQAGNPAVVSSTCTPTLAGGATCTIVTRRVVLESDRPGPLQNTVTVNYNPTGFPNNVGKSASDSVTINPPPGDEGCTPGFWKNHPEAWVGFTTGQTLESVFNVPDVLGLDNATLDEALSFHGGSGTVGAARILLRAAVASLLNAASPGVDFPLTTAQVIAQVNTALASGDRATILALAAELDDANNLGCPL